MEELRTRLADALSVFTPLNDDEIATAVDDTMTRHDGSARAQAAELREQEQPDADVWSMIADFLGQ